MATATAPTGTTTAANAGPCPYPVLQVAAGVDVYISWHNLTEDIDGNPIEDIEFATLKAFVLTLDAATAEATCYDSFTGDDIASRHTIVNDEKPEAIISKEILPEGLATALALYARGGNIAALLLEPTTASTVDSIEFTTDAWVR